MKLKNRNTTLIEIVFDLPHATFRCKKCGQVWAPAFKSGGPGYFRYGSWQCPRGCRVINMK